MFPDVTEVVAQGLWRNVYYHFPRAADRERARKTSPKQRVKVACMVAEMTKFRLVSFRMVFRVFDSLLDAFAVDADPVEPAERLATLADSCGRFLERTDVTSPAMNRRLARLEKLAANHHAGRLSDAVMTVVANVGFACRPPPPVVRTVQRRPVVEEYIRALLFDTLEVTTVVHVFTQLRRLDWSLRLGEAPTEHENYLLAAILDVESMRFRNLGMVAALVGGLADECGHQRFAVRVVDVLCDQIGLDIRRNDFRDCHRRLLHVRLLGELYNYRVVEADLIFRTLDSFIRPGDGEEDPQDPIRVQLVSALLAACGFAFRPKSRDGLRLDKFLVFFQVFLYSKHPLPSSVDFTMRDTLANIRPRMMWFDSLPVALGVAQGLREMEARGDVVVADTVEEEDEEEDEEEEAEDEEEVVESVSESDEDGSEEESSDEGSILSDFDESTMTAEELAEYVRETGPSEQELQFDRELNAAMADALVERRRMAGATRLNVAIPIALREYEGGAGARRNVAAPEPGVETFKMLMRRGAKSKTKDVTGAGGVGQARGDGGERREAEQEAVRATLKHADRLANDAVAPLAHPVVAQVHLRRRHHGQGRLY